LQLSPSLRLRLTPRQVEAVVRPWRLPNVVAALSAGGIRGVTAYEVKGLGAQGGVRERYNGHEFDDATLVEKAKVEVVVVASQVNDVVNIIVDSAQTGEIGDGKIFIVPIADIIRIRTAEHGSAAERMRGGREDLLRAGPTGIDID
jgi:nitrogen regulatory protein PII